ncbi:PHD finger protein-like protein [Tasmannia lanceolata]|uniref:PHD finger protein-like protein n=1 Tax=Tasmannia lanceolata TaxID=3420 RepID=UPI004063A7EA
MAEAFEDEMEHTVTIDEYIKGVEQQELEADLVLGGDEGNECTYSKGYMKRQAIFSCLTCIPNGNAGVCTACSLSCHDGHEIVELWTKRNFRCDCGNSKFGKFLCKLFADKDPENLENSYNQNFKGSYCTCARPYPDPDAEEQSEMIQCCICEDWFHENHIGLKSSEEVPRDEDGEPFYEDFICQECALVFSFLKLYPNSIWVPAKNSNDVPVITSGEENVWENGPLACVSSVMLENGIHTSEKQDMGAAVMDADSETGLIDKDALGSKNSEEHLGLKQENAYANNAASSSKCIVGVDQSVASIVSEKKPMFLSKNWRGLLCRCSTCVELYAQKGIGYLIDKEDSLVEYEKMAKEKRQEKLQEQEGVELNFLNKLGHVQKIEILNGIADMKNELCSFLESFDSSKPVTSADVHQVFENLAKKRQRTQ